MLTKSGNGKLNDICHHLDAGNNSAAEIRIESITNHVTDTGPKSVLELEICKWEKILSVEAVIAQEAVVFVAYMLGIAP